MEVSVVAIESVNPELIIQKKGLKTEIHGVFLRCFDDRLHLLLMDWSYVDITTLNAPAGVSVWDKSNDLDIRQVIGFYPDMIRRKEFNFRATAYDKDDDSSYTKNYKIIVYDPNWETGKNNFKNLLTRVAPNDSNSN